MADLNYGNIKDMFGDFPEDDKFPVVPKKNDTASPYKDLKHGNGSDNSDKDHCFGSENQSLSLKGLKWYSSKDDGDEKLKLSHSPIELTSFKEDYQLKTNNSESKEIRLSQLSSERDRSISVDRSSGSSRGSPKKSIHSENNKESDNKKEPSSHKQEKDKESSERLKRSRSKYSRSRSRSRSPSRQRKRDSPTKDIHRSRDRHYDRSPRKRSPPSRRRSRSRSRDRHNRRSRSRDKRSRSRGRRSRSRSQNRDGRGYRRRSRSFERRRYHRDRSSSRDRYKRRRSRSRSRSRSRGRLNRDRSKGRLTGLNKVASLTLPTSAGPMTPQMALQQTMAAMSAKAQALTGIELPKYYNPAAVNPLKYAEQVQKRKLLWDTKKETKPEQPKSSVWDKLTFNQDQDGKMTEKFRKLMGIKAGESESTVPKEPTVSETPNEAPVLKNQEELFRNLDQQYEMARMSTHTHRGVGLGYSSQTIFPPFQKP